MIQRFTARDPVEPRLQRTAATEAPNTAKGLQENVLRDVGRIAGLRRHSRYQAINRPRVMRDQPVEGCARAALQLRNELGFVAGPGGDARQARQVSRLSCLSAPSASTGDPRKSPRAMRGKP